MATIIGSTSSSLWSFKLEVVENSTSIASNSSKVTVTAYIGRPSSAGGSYLYGANITCPVSVTGAGSKSITYSNANQVNVAGGGWLSLGSVVFDSVPHDANGSKTVTVSANFTSDISPASGSASGSVKLTDIPRASTFTIDKTTIYANGKDAITVNITAKNTAYRHTVTVAMGSSFSQTFNVAAGTTKQAFTVPYAWLNGIPNQESSNSTNVILSTYNGTTLVGTASLPHGFTVKCPDDVVPVISGVTLTGINLRDGVYVQGKSAASIKTVAGGVYGSQLVSCVCEVDGVKYNSGDFVTAPLKSHGAYNLTVTVTDGRGKTASKAVPAFTVYEYKAPYITSFTAERQADGTTVIATLVGGVSSLNGKNGKAFTVTLNGTTKHVTSADFTVNGSVTFTDIDTDSTFIATAVVADWYADAKMPIVVSTEAVTMDFHHSGKGIAFGKVSQEEELIDTDWAIKSPSIGNLAGGYGTHITNGADLNTPTYLAVGTYVANIDVDVSQLKNCPTTNVFTMTVANVIGKSTTPDNSVRCFLIREITNMYGRHYCQYVHCDAGGEWMYGAWQVLLDTSEVKDFVIEQGTTADGWEYTKWNNGKIELWADKTLDFPATEQVSTYVWYTYVHIDMGDKLTKILGGSCSVQYEGVVPQLCRNSTVHTWAEVMIVTSRTLTAFTKTIPIYIIGKWK